MDHATVSAWLLATPCAAALGPLTIELLPVLTRIAHLILSFRAAEPTPASCYHCETQLQDALREMGRIIVQWTYNHLEPDDRHLMPAHLRSDGAWYRRRAETPHRSVATLFGTITLWRYLYQPIHGVGRAIFPLGLRLGLVARRATPALAERVAHAAADSPQETVRADLRRDHVVAWSVATLRAVIAATWDAMAPQLHAAPVAQVLRWLEQARTSRGARTPVRAVGRDGVFVPLRGEEAYREASTATASAYDRAGRRLGTVDLGQMPESGQGTRSEQLTALLTAVLTQWSGPLPRLAYVTDAGHHATASSEQVSKPMRHPSRPGEPLEWAWVIDYSPVTRDIHDLSAALFRDARRAQAWARKMCRWLKTKPRAIHRVLHPAAALRSRRIVPGQSKAYHKAYSYLRDHLPHPDSVEYQRRHLPIGSGVTEAACKTVFSRRLKRSGMVWSVEGGQRIVDLRVIPLSGVWSAVYQSYLQSQMLPAEGTQGEQEGEDPRKAA